jgi:hypothetical protein
MPPAPKPDDASLRRLREEILAEMGAAEEELARLRIRIERLESDQRLGAERTAEYEELKGRRLPQLERQVIEAYGSLVKVETKILEARRGGG